VPITIEIVVSDKAIAANEQKLAEFGDQITVVKTIKDGVTQSFVFDVDSDQKTETESISTKVSYDVGTTLPESIKPTAQTEIIIVAADNAPSAVQPAETPAP
jgi:hypothetical protein